MEKLRKEVKVESDKLNKKKETISAQAIALKEKEELKEFLRALHEIIIYASS